MGDYIDVYGGPTDGVYPHSWAVYHVIRLGHVSMVTSLLSSPRSAVSLKWRLHFEFVTAREPVEAPTVPENQSEIITWTGAEHIDVDTFSWDLPIKVLPTNPLLASYVSPASSSHSICI